MTYMKLTTVFGAVAVAAILQTAHAAGPAGGRVLSVEQVAAYMPTMHVFEPTDGGALPDVLAPYSSSAAHKGRGGDPDTSLTKYPPR